MDLVKLNVDYISFIEVTTKEQLKSIIQEIKNGNKKAAIGRYILKDDIDFEGEKICCLGTVKNPFKGIFDGNGHIISNFHIKESLCDYCAFFGKAENCIIININIKGALLGDENVAGFIGNLCGGFIKNCSCNIKCSNLNIKFYCENSGKIEKCNFTKEKIELKLSKSMVFLSIIAIGIFITAVIPINRILAKYSNDYSYSNIENSGNIDNNPQNNNSYYSSKNDNSSDFIKNQTSINEEKGNSSSSFGNMVSFEFQTSAYINETVIEFYFKNPKTSNKNISIEIILEMDNDKISIAQSEIIKPSEYIEYIYLNEGISLPNGEYSANALLHFYNIDTQKEESITSVIPITIYA